MEFSPSEILQMAEELERRGIDFYAGLIGKTNDPEAKKIFSLLENQEKQHLSFFQGIHQQLNEDRDPLVDTLDETTNYLGAIVENSILGKSLKGMDLLQGDSSVSRALAVGIEVEKESVLFYQGLEVMILPQKREWLNRVIQEEKKHFLTLIEIKKDVDGRAI
ncbi:MAG: ferritin family protein [Atribacterota bacterium]